MRSGVRVKNFLWCNKLTGPTGSSSGLEGGRQGGARPGENQSSKNSMGSAKKKCIINELGVTGFRGLGGYFLGRVGRGGEGTSKTLRKPVQQEQQGMRKRDYIIKELGVHACMA
jgi:hypothetical protein